LPFRHRARGESAGGRFVLKKFEKKEKLA